ncbi:MAG: type IV toxin-antitoxin system AbiEi family antitoxin domain-containing protein [Candidatus Hydrogenedentes bacterium]|nr:type IV toxin-antitoxin system AbiEi family antitoxin domain-containing protein [Candidatus Hydrogenedentota bacterium]
MTTHLEILLRVAESKGLIRARDLAAHGIPRQYLSIACDRGLLERLDRGLYAVPGALQTEHRSLVEVCKLIPHGVICLLSALQFHGMTTQNPFEVWLAIGESKGIPRTCHVPLRIARFSGESLKAGVESHDVDGTELRVFTAAKTVADCFKYRNKIGVDIAAEALRDYLRQRKGPIDGLTKYARVCRVERVMEPYLEALL